MGDVLFPSPTFIHAEAFLSPTGIFSDSSTGKNSGPQARFINHRPGSSKDIKVTLKWKTRIAKAFGDDKLPENNGRMAGTDKTMKNITISLKLSDFDFF